MLDAQGGLSQGPGRRAHAPARRLRRDPDGARGAMSPENRVGSLGGIVVVAPRPQYVVPGLRCRPGREGLGLVGPSPPYCPRSVVNGRRRWSLHVLDRPLGRYVHRSGSNHGNGGGVDLGPVYVDRRDGLPCHQLRPVFAALINTEPQVVPAARKRQRVDVAPDLHLPAWAHPRLVTGVDEKDRRCRALAYPEVDPGSILVAALEVELDLERVIAAREGTSVRPAALDAEETHRPIYA